MAHVFDTAIQSADLIGIHAVFLEAKNRNLVRPYTQFGFFNSIDNPLHMYLAIDTLKASLNDE